MTAAADFGRALTLTAASTFVGMLVYAGPLGNASTLSAELGASTAETTWILSSLSLAVAVALLPFGAYADLHGRRRVFAASAWLLSLGSLGCALAPTPLVFVLGRVVQGFGLAGLVATGLGLVAAVAPDPQQRATLGVWWAASLGLGIAAGPVVTGALDQVTTWTVFYWLLLLCSIAVALSARWAFVETPVVPGRRLDLLGTALLAVGTGAGLSALIEGRQGDVAICVVMAVVGLVSLAAFVEHQRRGRHPLVDRDLLRRRDFVAATVAAGAAGAGVIGTMAYTPTFLVAALHQSTLEAGLSLALWSATGAASALVVRRFAARVAGTTQLVVGLTGTGVGLLLLTGLGDRPSLGRLVPGLVVAGLATGVLNTGLGRQATATVPDDDAALGAAVNNTTRYVGAAVGVTIAAVIAHDPTRTDVAGWNVAVIVAGAVALLSAVLVRVIDPSARARRA